MSQVFGERPTAPRGGSGCAWVMWLFLIGGLLLVLAMTALVAFGWSLFSDQARAALQRDPVITEHIGTIAEMSVNFTATGEAEGSDEFVWDLEGDKGSGRVVAQLVTDNDGEALAGGTLTMADGRSFAVGGSESPDVEETGDTPMDADGIEPVEDGAPVDNYKSADGDKAPPPVAEPAPEPPPVEVE